MKFRTPFEDIDVVPTDPGDQYRIDYVRRFDDKGNPYLLESGKTDIQEYIQSFAQEVDLSYVLNRFVNGDVSAIQQRQGFYADVRVLPHDLAEAYDMMRRAHSVFERLPDAAREKVGTFSEFLSVMNEEKSFLAFNKFLLDLDATAAGAGDGDGGDQSET